MPKGLWKIERFDAGLNNNSDPRDINDNELAKAEGIAVDKVGIVYPIGHNTAHDAGTPDNTRGIIPGYGLHSFSHDRVNAHYHGNHLQDPDMNPATHWDVTGKALVSSGTIAFAFSSGTLDGTAEQVYGDRLIAGTNSAEYEFTYTCAVTIAPNYFTLTLGNFPSSGVSMPFTAGTHTVTFTSHASANVRAFTITGADDVGGTTTQGNFALSAFILRRVGASAGADAETGDNYLVNYGKSGRFDIYSAANDLWGLDAIDISGDMGGSTGVKACFYNADGSLRISDGNFGTNNRNTWFGYIKTTHFDGITPDGGGANPYTYDSWYSKSLALAPPSDGIYGQYVNFTALSAASTTNIEVSSTSNALRYMSGMDGRKYIAVTADDAKARIITEVHSGDDDFTVEALDSGDWATDDIHIYPPAGAGWNVYIKSSSTSGNWSAGGYEVATSFIYQGNQESKLNRISPQIRPAVGGEVINIGASIDVKIYATAPYDPFIVGGRVYIRKYGLENQPWVLLADISLSDGVRKDLTSTYGSWSQTDYTGSGDAASHVYMTVDLGAIENPSPWTYKAINGYDGEEEVSIGNEGEGFKTAVVANRQVYIGNVRRTDKDGVVKTEGDAMYKSMPGKFDTFPVQRKIEASVQDGDEIIKLEEYADRILQFKKNKMHLINISQNIEFLEDTFMFKGVSQPSAVCKTDFGIAWVNKFGCYLYDGQTVNNLFEKKGFQIIDEDEWETFSTNAPMIGYYPKKRQLIIVDDNTTTGTGKMFLYDMVTQSWVTGSGGSFTSQTLTNLITDYNGDLIHAHTHQTSTFLKWTSTPETGDTDSHIITKDMDFGQPSIRKKIYKVRISYKGNALNVTVRYTRDGDTDSYYSFFGTDSDGASTGVADTTPLLDKTDVTKWHQAELVPSTQPTDMYSFQLHLDGNIGEDFKINDLTVIYKTKPIR